MTMSNPSYLTRLVIIIGCLLAVGFVFGYLARAVGEVRQCQGLWTGNACIGSESRVTGQEYYEGTTEVYRGEKDQFVPYQGSPRHR